MAEAIEIKGGAGEFEAAVIAVVIDRIAEEQKAAVERRGRISNTLPAWVRAVRRQDHPLPRDLLKPE